jgi:hypothetical protein
MLHSSRKNNGHSFSVTGAESRRIFMEKRILTAQASLRAESQGNKLVLAGYAARFNVLSHDLGGFREKIQPGAFKQSLAAGDDVRCLFNHDANHVLGRTASGTLKLSEDDKGLAFRCQLDPTQVAHRDLHSSVKRGDISDCSFAFVVQDGGDDYADASISGTNCIIRTVKNVKLLDVSVVTNPAYPQTSVDARKVVNVTNGANGGLPPGDYIVKHFKHNGVTVFTEDDQFSIKKQIAAWDARHKRRIVGARALAAKYPGVALEDIAIRSRIYSGDLLEDVLLQLRSAAIARQIGAGPMRDGGQAQDPQQSLRDDDDDDSFEKWLYGNDDDDDFDDDTRAMHTRAQEYHCAAGRKSPTVDRAVEQFKCADAHSLAVRSGKIADSRNARAESRRLRG